MTAWRVRSAAVYLVFLLSLSLLLALGGWQWRRGLDKAAVERLLENTADQYITLTAAPPDWADLAYRRVRLEGGWLPDRAFLLANRVHRGRAGFEVLSPFRLAGDGATLLVNRGWVASAAALSSADLTADAEVRGQLHLPQKGFTLGAAAETAQPSASAGETWPKTIQYFDAPALSALLGAPLAPAVAVLDPAHPAAFVRIWRAYAMTPARHYAYAVQWWGLAVTLLVFGVIWRRQAACSR